LEQFGYQDSANKRSQNSECRDAANVTTKSGNKAAASQQPASVPRGSSSSTKKVQVQKLVKNQSFLKPEGSKQADFYNTIFKNLQAAKITAKTPHQAVVSQPQSRLSDHQQPMKEPIAISGQQHVSKTTRVSGVGTEKERQSLGQGRKDSIKSNGASTSQPRISHQTPECNKVKIDSTSLAA